MVCDTAHWQLGAPGRALERSAGGVASGSQHSLSGSGVRPC
jgi:hypothetical protein